MNTIGGARGLLSMYPRIRQSNVAASTYMHMNARNAVACGTRCNATLLIWQILAECLCRRSRTPAGGWRETCRRQRIAPQKWLPPRTPPTALPGLPTPSAFRPIACAVLCSALGHGGCSCHSQLILHRNCMQKLEQSACRKGGRSGGRAAAGSSRPGGVGGFRGSCSGGRGGGDGGS